MLDKDNISKRAKFTFSVLPPTRSLNLHQVPSHLKNALQAVDLSYFVSKPALVTFLSDTDALQSCHFK